MVAVDYGELKLFLHKYIYPNHVNDIMNCITSRLDVFSIEPNGLGFKARVKKGNLKRGQDALSCFKYYIAIAMSNFMSLYANEIYHLAYQHQHEFSGSLLEYISSYNIELLFDVILMQDNYIQIYI